MTKPIDYAGLAAALLARAESLLSQWLPAGVARGDRFYCGDFDGSAGESANVNLRTGQWIDNGSKQDSGSDLISLYARVQGLSNSAAARELLDQMGWHADAPPPPPPQPAKADKRRTTWRAVVPVPGNAPAPDFTWRYRDAAGAWVELRASRTWRYERDGQTYGFVARFDRVNSHGEAVKDVIPRTWCVDDGDERGTHQWRWKAWDAPRPLYLPAGTLSADAAHPVCVVEGEKCADSAHALLGAEFDFVSWPGGGKTTALADWGWVAGRTVYLWPDCDAQREPLTKAQEAAGADPASAPLRPATKQPGVATMRRLAELLQGLGCTVRMVPIPAPGAVPPGWDVADAIASGWTAERVRGAICAAGAWQPADAPRTPGAAGAGSGDGVPERTWHDLLLCTDKGAPKPVRENAVACVDGVAWRGAWLPGEVPHGHIQFNEFTNNVERGGDMPWGAPPGPWDETDELELGHWLVREHGLPSMSRQTLEEAVSMVARRHRTHPAREAIEAFRGTWDGEPRLRHWLARVCRSGVEHDPADPLTQYLQRVGTWFMMGICARMLEPGVKFDYMLILEGPQGTGKSTLARILSLGWFADTGLVLGDKDSYQNLQGVMVYEWGELDSLTRTEVTKVKQFISSQVDRFRASFDRRPRNYPRQVVFVGTTNESHYLSDPTGNRRFWPVRCAGWLDLAWLRENLGQMFAEALQMIDQGERFAPTPREQAELFEPQQTERTVESSLESAIRRLLFDENQLVGIGPHARNWALAHELTLADLLGAMSISVDKQTQALCKQASAVLGRLGWERRRGSARGDDKKRPWVYVRPGHDDPTGAAAPQSARQQPARVGISASEDVTDDCPF